MRYDAVDVVRASVPGWSGFPDFASSSAIGNFIPFLISSFVGEKFGALLPISSFCPIWMHDAIERQRRQRPLDKQLSPFGITSLGHIGF